MIVYFDGISCIIWLGLVYCVASLLVRLVVYLFTFRVWLLRYVVLFYRSVVLVVTCFVCLFYFIMMLFGFCYYVLWLVYCLLFGYFLYAFGRFGLSCMGLDVVIEFGFFFVVAGLFCVIGVVVALVLLAGLMLLGVGIVDYSCLGVGISSVISARLGFGLALMATLFVMWFIIWLFFIWLCFRFGYYFELLSALRVFAWGWFSGFWGWIGLRLSFRGCIFGVFQVVYFRGFPGGDFGDFPVLRQFVGG